MYALSAFSASDQCSAFEAHLQRRRRRPRHPRRERDGNGGRKTKQYTEKEKVAEIICLAADSSKPKPTSHQNTKVPNHRNEPTTACASTRCSVDPLTPKSTWRPWDEAVAPADAATTLIGRTIPDTTVDMLAGRAAPAPAAVHSGVLSTDPQEVRPKVTLPGAKSAGDADVISVQKTEETRIRAGASLPHCPRHPYHTDCAVVERCCERAMGDGVPASMAWAWQPTTPCAPPTPSPPLIAPLRPPLWPIVLIFKKAQAEMRRRRRMIRSVCFLLNLLFITLFWALGTGINHPVMYHQAYDPAYLVTIELAGCDLYFVPGDTADIKFTALAKAVDFGGPAWRNHPIDSDSYAQGGEFLNVLDEACSMVPLNNCSRVCKIEITVPPSAAGVADFHVYQLAGDNALAPYVYVQPGVSFKSLYVGAWFRRAPTLNIELTGATVGTLDMYLRHGDFRSVNSSVDTYRVRCAGTGARGCLGEVAKSLCITARLDALSARRFRHLPPLQERRKARATLVVPPPPTQPLPLPITLIAHILRITGSIYLLDMPVIDTPVKTKWRQPSNRFCAASVRYATPSRPLLNSLCCQATLRPPPGIHIKLPLGRPPL